MMSNLIKFSFRLNIIIIVLVMKPLHGLQETSEEIQEELIESEMQDLQELQKIQAQFKPEPTYPPEQYSTEPDVYRNTPEYITSRGFEYESHYVVTNDGYILNVFRIINPYIRPSKRKRPIYLQHGVTASSDDFVYSQSGSIENGVYFEGDIINDCRKTFTRTIGFSLAACGYDVWMGNLRGNIYSKNHTYLNAYNDTRFWQFSIDHHALIDVPAIIHYILMTSGRTSLGYIGHSMGTTLMFMLQSYHPQYEKVVKPFIALAPIVYMGHTWTLARIFIGFEPFLRENPGGFGLPENITTYLGAHLCGNSVYKNLCADIAFAFSGSDHIQLNNTRIPVYVARSSQWTSTWVLAQYCQFIARDKFEKMDYGPIDNLKVYGQLVPPQYNVSNITSRSIALFRGLNDAFADNIDVQHLVDEMTVPLLDDYIVPFALWNHADFVIAIEAGRYIVSRIFKLLSLFN